jgi:nitrite reductase/ring-hydroxylating ferredoxin subunit
MLQLFVMAVHDLKEGDTLLYQTPDGHTVNITRRGSGAGAGDFVALGSTCPHLGCQVKWEPQNNRYFCPCHNGTFDPSGKATGGPPGDAGLSLPKYTLSVQRGMLFIDVPAERLTLPQRAGVVHLSGPHGAGHDPCLACLERGRRRREAIG